MPTYLTKIRKPTGETEEHLLTVPQDGRLEDYLSRLQGLVIDCEPYESSPAVVARPETPAVDAGREIRWRSHATDLLVFTSYLQTLVHAGVPLARSLEIVRNQMTAERWPIVIRELIASLQKGNSFADSLRRFPRFFPTYYVHLVDVGEVSGNLGLVLEKLATYGERQLENRGRLIGVMIYPALLVSACGGAVLFLIVFVLPRLARMFENLDLPLPALTRGLLSIGVGLREHGLLVLAVAVATVGGLVAASRTPRGQRVLARLLLTMPLFGKFYRKVLLSRFCQTLSLLQSSGVSLLVSLNLARTGIGNPELEEFFADVERNLQEGAPLGEQMARSPHVPEMVSSMVSVGEETGRLSEMLQNVSRFYERDIELNIRSIPKILEPAVIVFMTIVVGTIAASVFLPLATLTRGLGSS